VTHPTRPPRRHAAATPALPALLALLTAAVLTLPACGGKAADGDERAERLASLTYPGDAAEAPHLDIVARHDGKRIELFNRTPRGYRDMQLWLNRQYVSDGVDVAIGNNDPVPLDGFLNQHGEHYPTPGFLSPEKAFPVVLAELVDPASGARHTIVVEREGGDLLGGTRGGVDED